MGDITTDFIRQNEWANLVVIDRCRGLTDDQLDVIAGRRTELAGRLQESYGISAD